MSQSKLAISITRLQTSSRRVDRARLHLLSPTEAPLSSTPVFQVNSISQHPLLIFCPDNQDHNILLLQNPQAQRIGQYQFDSTLRSYVGKGAIQIVLDCVGIIQVKLTIVVWEADQARLIQQRNSRTTQNKQILLQIVRLNSSLDFMSKQNSRLTAQLQSSNQTISRLLALNSSISNELALHKRLTSRITRQLNLSQLTTITVQQQSKIGNALSICIKRARKSQGFEKQLNMLKKYESALWRLSEQNSRDAQISRLQEKIQSLEGQLRQATEAYDQLQRQFDQYQQQADGYCNELEHKTELLQDANQQMSVSIQKANKIADFPSRLNKLATSTMNTMTALTSQLAKCGQINSLQSILANSLNQLLHGLQQNQFFMDAAIYLQLPLLRGVQSKMIERTTSQMLYGSYTSVHLNN